MSDRFFAPSPILSERVVLTGAEAHHLLHVIRARPGCRVTLLDGSLLVVKSCIPVAIGKLPVMSEAWAGRVRGTGV